MTEKQLEQHNRAAYKLDQIMRAAFMFIRHNADDIDEQQVRLFLIQRLKSNQLVSDKDNPIVAFGRNCANIHYFASDKSRAKLKKDDLIMIDLWARMNEPGAPFADITWMGYHGDKFEGEFSDKFELVTTARDLAVKFIRSKVKNGTIPSGEEIDNLVRGYFGKSSVAEHFCHTTGHPLGTTSAHGRSGGGIWWRNKRELNTNLAYTIEPGLYFKERYGIRSELDFYITPDFELVITSEPQKKIILI